MNLLTGIRLRLLAAIVLTASSSEAAVRTISTGGRNVWRLAVGQLDADSSSSEIVGGAYDGRVCAFAESGTHLWDYETGGFVFDVAVGDLDGDGVGEVLAATAGGSVICLSSDGELLWQRELKAPVFQVAVARFAGGKPVVVAGGVSRQLLLYDKNGEVLQVLESRGAIRQLLVGDFNGDKKDELFVRDMKSGRGKDGSIYSGWPLSREQAVAKALLPRRAAEECSVADVDQDGVVELVTPKAALSLLPTPSLDTEFSHASLPRPDYSFFYRMPMVAVGNLQVNAGQRIAVLNGPDLRLYDNRGRVIDKVRMPFGCADLACLPGPGQADLLFASRPNGDDNLYRVRLEPGWKRELAGATSPGVLASIADELTRLNAAAEHWSGKPLDRDEPCYPIQIAAGWVDSPQAERVVSNSIKLIRRYESQFPYENLCFATALWIDEAGDLARPDGKTWNRDRRLKHRADRGFIRRVAQRMEREKASFWVQVGHGCAPHLSVDACREIMRLAPTACLGFVSAEDEQPEELEYYLDHHVLPLMDLCVETGGDKMFILREKNTWWASLGASEKVARKVLRDKYRQVLVPSVEDSNSRTPDLNLAARVGLWKAGRVDRWCCRMVADCFSFNRAWEWEYSMAGHPHLRYLTAHTALGASVFMIKVGQHSVATGELTAVGTQAVAPFLHLLGRGVIAPPTVASHEGAFSPISVGVTQPTRRFLREGLNGHHYDRFVDRQDDAFFCDRVDCFWGMAPTPRYDVGSTLWGRKRQFGNFIPVCPNGFVTLAPLAAFSGPGAQPALSWTTDGDALMRDGRPQALQSGTSELARAVVEAAAALPFRLEGEAFFQAVAEEDDAYVVYLIDPGYLQPTLRRVKLIANQRADWVATDRITGEHVGAFDQTLSVSIPAGSIRVLELTKVND